MCVCVCVCVYFLYVAQSAVRRQLVSFVVSETCELRQKVDAFCLCVLGHDLQYSAILLQDLCAAFSVRCAVHNASV